MSTKKVIVQSRFALTRQWLIDQLQKHDYTVSTEDDKSDRNCVKILEVANQTDEEMAINLSLRGYRIIVYSRFPIAQLLGVIFKGEILGLIHSQTELDDLDRTIESAFNDDVYFDGTTLTYVLSDKFRSINERVSALSKRELEIVDGILDDLSNEEIAEKFDLSVRTVNAHKRNILHKMQERSLVGVSKTMLMHTLRYV